ncbi:DUF4399 domain-containing protein [Parvibaculum sedimenti]|uniref:DUF4399 domain-containing protein n=1 Tax=Parvibaculum sedimenti TaxID=2608632 RepID=A0A6N6VRG1_9HYPH|nr:DUF4399 domain-containing protein [Parvibaculum sedimenti]KAB7742584.1 DUF4399 domain-containing protein [Parvibaculum sedimenti]
MSSIRTATLAAALMLAGVSAAPAWAEEAAAPTAQWPAEAKAYIISPKNGAKVKSPVTVVFGLKGLGVAPAGVDKAKTGHHHLLIDADLPKGEELNDPLPKDEHHMHFGGGQTEATIELAPGKHTLQLVMGDANHVPHNPPVTSEKITITVVK